MTLAIHNPGVILPTLNGQSFDMQSHKPLMFHIFTIACRLLPLGMIDLSEQRACIASKRSAKSFAASYTCRWLTVLCKVQDIQDATNCVLSTSASSCCFGASGATSASFTNTSPYERELPN